MIRKNLLACFTISLLILFLTGCARPLSWVVHTQAHQPFVYDQPSTITFSQSSVLVGEDTTFVVNFGVTKDELETYQAVITLPLEFSFNGFDALGPVNTQIGDYTVQFLDNNGGTFTIPIRSIDFDNAYADRDLDGIFNVAIDTAIVHTGNHTFTATFPFGGDGNPGILVGPFNESGTVTLLSGLISNPVVPGNYTLTGSFTSIDPDTDAADDQSNHNPLNFDVNQVVAISVSSSNSSSTTSSGGGSAFGWVELSLLLVMLWLLIRSDNWRRRQS
ncbi:MAG: hypothetical protein ACE5EH_12830 [Gammaproteobacteria bacterium]